MTTPVNEDGTVLGRIVERLRNPVENALDPQAAARAAADLARGHAPCHTHTLADDGRCVVCRRTGAAPLSTWNTTRTPPNSTVSYQQEHHCHGVSTEAWCELCSTDNDLVRWPCLPLRRATGFLGVPIEDISGADTVAITTRTESGQ